MVADQDFSSNIAKKLEMLPKKRQKGERATGKKLPQPDELRESRALGTKDGPGPGQLFTCGKL